MKRFDRYDVIGALVATLVVALWVAHFVVPAAPPLPDDPLAQPAIGAPGIGGPGIGR